MCHTFIPSNTEGGGEDIHSFDRCNTGARGARAGAHVQATRERGSYRSQRYAVCLPDPGVHVTTLEHPTTNATHASRCSGRATPLCKQLVRGPEAVTGPAQCTRLHHLLRTPLACATLPETHVRPQVGNAPLLCRPMTATCEIVSLRLTLVRRAHAMDSTSQMATAFRVALGVWHYTGT